MVADELHPTSRVAPDLPWPPLPTFPGRKSMAAVDLLPGHRQAAPWTLQSRSLAAAEKLRALLEPFMAVVETSLATPMWFSNPPSVDGGVDRGQ
jgi:hypothetical protein